MANIIISNTIAAESESNAIAMKSGMIQKFPDLAIVSTNLPVVGNLREVHILMNSCNENYKRLLISHASSITKLGKEFSNLDSDMADKMQMVKD